MTDPLHQRYTALAGQDTCLSCSPNLRPRIALQPQERLLELGCGQGSLLRGLAGEVTEATLVGLDATQAMLDRARALDPDGRVEWRLGRMEALPFADQQFDWVVADCSLNHAWDKLTVVKEIYRVLKWGATAVIAEPVTEDPLPETTRQDPQARADCFGGCITKAEWVTLFKAAGFLSPAMTSLRSYRKRNVAFESVHIIVKKEITP